jgi:hypothetical protein
MFTSNTSGDNYCFECRTNKPNTGKLSTGDMPLPSFGKQEGWICPVCGRGVAPWVDVCPCQKDAGVINVTTTTESVDLSKYYTLINDITVPEAKLESADLLEGDVDAKDFNCPN